VANGAISEDLKRFINTNINPIEPLEILLILFDEQSRAWTVQELAQRLYTQPTSVLMRLTDLPRRNLCLSTEDQERRYRYRSGEVAWHKSVRELKEAYQVRHVTIIVLIFSKPSDSLTMFSDAFRLRG
jgi:predicted P-loop ATPase/GTPase